MVRIISIFLITFVDILAYGKPINRGFTVKFNPILLKGDVKPKTFGALFTKIPHEAAQESINRDFPTTDLYVNYTKRAAQILSPSKHVNANNNSETFERFINIPIIPQPFPDYKIIVATAPWNVRISGDQAKPAVIYVVFPEDDSDSKSMNIPAIYFIRKRDGDLNMDRLLNKRDRIDPVIIVDSNRTVTGLKSNEVPKYVKFKSKLSKVDTYKKVTPLNKPITTNIIHK